MKNEKVYLLFRDNNKRTEPFLLDASSTEKGINKCLKSHICFFNDYAEGSAEYLDRKKNYFIIEKELKDWK